MRSTRADAGLSLRALAEAADVAVSTIHRIERGDIHPSVDTLRRTAEAAGVGLRLAAEPDGAASVVGLALCIRRDVERPSSPPSSPRQGYEATCSWPGVPPWRSPTKPVRRPNASRRAIRTSTRAG